MLLMPLLGAAVNGRAEPERQIDDDAAGRVTAVVERVRGSGAAIDGPGQAAPGGDLEGILAAAARDAGIGRAADRERIVAIIAVDCPAGRRLGNERWCL